MESEKIKRLGIYQKTVLKGIARKGKQPVTIKDGYSRQVKRLKQRKLICQKGDYLFLTKTGKNRIKKLRR